MMGRPEGFLFCAGTVVPPVPFHHHRPTMNDFTELRGCFERILCVARSSAGPTVGNIQLADRLIGAVRAELGKPEGEGPDHANLIAFAYGREPWATWLKAGGCLESAHCELSDLLTAVLARWGHPAVPARKPFPVNLAELHNPDFSGGLTPSQHLDVLHGGADPRVAAASAPQPLERLSMGKLVSERIQELLDEVAQRGLEPSGVILGIRAEDLLRKEVRKSLLFQRNANQDNPFPLPNVQDQLFFCGVQINKSDVEAAEYVGIECQ